MFKTILLSVGLACCGFAHATSTLLQYFNEHKADFQSIPRIEFPRFINKNACSDLDILFDACAPGELGKKHSLKKARNLKNNHEKSDFKPINHFNKGNLVTKIKSSTESKHD